MNLVFTMTCRTSVTWMTDVFLIVCVIWCKIVAVHSNERFRDTVSNVNSHMAEIEVSLCRHPLCCPLLPQLPLYSSRHLPPLGRLPRLGRYDTHPWDEALGLSSQNAWAQQSPILADCHTELPLKLWPARRSTKVCNLALSAFLNQRVKICWTISPCSCHQTLQVSKTLKPCHQRSRVPWCRPEILPIQPFQWPPVRCWKLPCPSVRLLFRPSWRIARDSGGHSF